MTAYYNEFDPFDAAWLRNLISAGHIAPGEVDERSIVDVRPDDLRGFSQCHFFAGIGGWSAALRLAGWPDTRPCWSASCPCPPFSSASRGRGKGFEDPRDLWPELLRLAKVRRPAVLFGEQVADARSWLDRLCDDMEALAYTIRARVLPAVSVAKDHLRYRIYFASHADGEGEPERSVDDEVAWLPRFGSVAGGMVPTHGVSVRMAQLRAFGNAIVPQVAAEVIAAFMACRP